MGSLATTGARTKEWRGIAERIRCTVREAVPMNLCKAPKAQ